MNRTLVFKCPYCSSRDSYGDDEMTTESRPPCYACGQELLKFDHCYRRRPTKYTVILALPDYLAEDCCDTRTRRLQEEEPGDAVRQARMDVAHEFDLDEEELGDLKVIAVYEGWRDNLIPEGEE